MTAKLRTHIATLRLWGPQTLVVIVFALALVAFAITPLQASRWMRAPFPGAFFEPGMRVSRLGLETTALAGGETLTQVENQPVKTGADLLALLSIRQPGQSVTLSFSGAPASRSLSLPLAALPLRLAANFFILPFVIGLIFLASGMWVFAIRRNQPAAQVFGLFSASVAVILAGLFDGLTGHALTGFSLAAAALASGSIIHLALVFPRRHPLNSRHPWLPALCYLPGALLLVNTLLRGEDFSNAWRLQLTLAGLSVLFFLAMLAVRRYADESPLVVEQSRLVLVSGLVSFLPLAIFVLVAGATKSAGMPSLLVLPMVVFPLATGYTIQRHQLLESSYVLARVVLYSLVTVLAAAGYALIVSGLSLVFSRSLSASNPLVIGATVFLVALAINPLRELLQRKIDAVFLRSERAYQELTLTFSHALTSASHLKEIIALLDKTLRQTFAPEPLCIFVFDPQAGAYIAMPGADGKPSSDLRWSAASPLVTTLTAARAPVFLHGSEPPEAIRSERARLALLGASLYIPLPGLDRVTGWLALGLRGSGEPYTAADVKFLTALAEQSALAIERAQVIENMEKRVHEVTILSRVAQGVNITISFDDILELVYAQTGQVLPARDFALSLYDPLRDTLIHALYVEDDERLPEMEAVPLPAGQGLDWEVVRSRRPLLADDYSLECQRRTVLPAGRHSDAWMGVPLNAGAETIGALSVCSRDPAITFTTDQLNLLQSIADQTAGAIVKARLLQETERRARQLTTLNEMTRQLSSTLELEPLLQNILDRAVEIINCEAGSLLLVDDQTDDLVFRVTVGPVAGDLIGRRMARGTGLVGKSVETRQSIITNQVQASPDWYSGNDRKTGYDTRALMVTPLQVKDNVIGVIEVINKRDGNPFGGDDEALLQAFASQAAIAIDNARLYTMTDHALAERVEELSVMQRIDRELNASLDISLAMGTTLDWAMRQSRANAGLIGVVEESGVRVTASQGYPADQESIFSAPLPLDFPPLRATIETGQPQTFSPEGAPESTLLNGTRAQLVIPIRREETVTGLLLLESTRPEPPSEDTLSFLTRLSDHAAIAIANAQLYATVRQANVAKSEFVSFVSHELKNPMTSIKGYTELLAAGAVGPINEAQANFLNTIRSNVERMSTLVSDLADVSRIEAGRLKLEFKPIKVVDVVEEVLRSTRRQIEEKEQRVVQALPNDLPPVWADRVRLIQVLTNLVSNAHKYTPKGGEITVGGERCPNRWDPKGSAEVVHLWVRDNGIGISPDDQKKIFQKFFRSEDPKTREAPGTGLGLNITKSLVEMQGGQIWFESELRQGTVFHITVPVSEQ